MNSLKSLSAKLFAIAMLVGMTAGCASVTDATVDDQPAPTTVEQPANPTPEGFGGGDDVQPIVDKPSD